MLLSILGILRSILLAGFCFVTGNIMEFHQRNLPEESRRALLAARLDVVLVGARVVTALRHLPRNPRPIDIARWECGLAREIVSIPICHKTYHGCRPDTVHPAVQWTAVQAMGMATAASMTGAPNLDSAQELSPTIPAISLLLSKAKSVGHSWVICISPSGLNGDTIHTIISSIPHRLSSI